MITLFLPNLIGDLIYVNKTHHSSHPILKIRCLLHLHKTTKRYRSLNKFKICIYKTIQSKKGVIDKKNSSILGGMVTNLTKKLIRTSRDRLKETNKKKKTFPLSLILKLIFPSICHSKA